MRAWIITLDGEPLPYATAELLGTSTSLLFLEITEAEQALAELPNLYDLDDNQSLAITEITI